MNHFKLVLITVTFLPSLSNRQEEIEGKRKEAKINESTSIAYVCIMRWKDLTHDSNFSHFKVK